MKDTATFNTSDIERMNSFKYTIINLQELQEEIKNLKFPEEIDPSEFVCLLIDNKINRIIEAQNKLIKECTEKE